LPERSLDFISEAWQYYCVMETNRIKLQQFRKTFLPNFEMTDSPLDTGAVVLKSQEFLGVAETREQTQLLEIVGANMRPDGLLVQGSAH
jgi:hypothetical protein